MDGLSFISGTYCLTLVSINYYQRNVSFFKSCIVLSKLPQYCIQFIVTMYQYWISSTKTKLNIKKNITSIMSIIYINVMTLDNHQLSIFKDFSESKIPTNVIDTWQQPSSY